MKGMLKIEKLKLKNIIQRAEEILSEEKYKKDTINDYDNIPNIASEARQKLNEIRPTTIAQALRISGVNPADISILMVMLDKHMIHSK